MPETLHPFSSKKLIVVIGYDAFDTSNRVALYEHILQLRPCRLELNTNRLGDIDDIVLWVDNKLSLNHVLGIFALAFISMFHNLAFVSILTSSSHQSLLHRYRYS